MVSESPLLHYNPPKEYPKEMQPTSYLRPMEVTFDRLKFAVKTATTKLMWFHTVLPMV